MRKGVRILFGIFMAGLLFGGCGKVPELIKVDMNYAPTNPVPPPKIFPGKTIFLGSFEDKRANPDLIGQNTEKGAGIPVRTDAGSVAPFVKGAFEKEFKKLGYKVVEAKESADRVMNLAIMNFWVEEKNTYAGSIVAKVSIQDKSGRTLASQDFRGLSSRWGSSLSEGEYRKALSDTVVDLLNNIFKDEAFMKNLA